MHERAVAEIVQMIRAKYEDEGTRNFAIGKRAYEHAQWQRGNFPGYTGSDFDSLMRRIRDDVRLYVPIKADSIRVDDWRDATSYASWSASRSATPQTLCPALSTIAFSVRRSHLISGTWRVRSSPVGWR